jgi:hypothetical protein
MEGGERYWSMVGRLHDGHASVRGCLGFVSYLIDSTGDFRLTYR